MEEVEDVGDLRRERLLGRKHLRAPGEVLEVARRIALGEHADAILVVGMLLEDEVEAGAHLLDIRPLPARRPLLHPPFPGRPAVRVIVTGPADLDDVRSGRRINRGVSLDREVARERIDPELLRDDRPNLVPRERVELATDDELPAAGRRDPNVVCDYV